MLRSLKELEHYKVSASDGDIGSVEKFLFDDELPRQAIKDSPEWDPKAAINREYEKRLQNYYKRAPYWKSRSKPSTASPSIPESRVE